MSASRNSPSAAEGAPRRVSVIIPTHRRLASLRRALDALAAQTYKADYLEVVVVADGRDDSTETMLSALKPAFALRTVTLPEPCGPASARNAGAAVARGEVLIFMDDDIVPVPGFVTSHAAAQTTSETVVIGYLPPVLGNQVGFFRVVLRRWWEDVFSRMRQPGYRFHAFDLLSGNVSMPATLFRRVGGFDERFTCHEDYELGVRLMEAGARFAFSGEASGAHHEATDLRRALRRKFDEGRADIALGQKHPEMIPELPLRRTLLSRSRGMRISRRVAFFNPKADGLVMIVGIAGLTVMELLRARRQWRRLLDDLLVYWYWRGIAEALGSAEAVARFADHVSHGTDSQAESTVDLRTGLPAAETRLQDDCRSGVRLTYGLRPVGRVLPRAGAEPLRGRHLRPMLEGPLAAPLLDAMACDGAIPAFLSAERLRALCRAQPVYRMHGVEPL